jgi:hypothetical protein
MMLGLLILHLCQYYLYSTFILIFVVSIFVLIIIVRLAQHFNFLCLFFLERLLDLLIILLYYYLMGLFFCLIIILNFLSIIIIICLCFSIYHFHDSCQKKFHLILIILKISYFRVFVLGISFIVLNSYFILLIISIFVTINYCLLSMLNEKYFIAFELSCSFNLSKFIFVVLVLRDQNN